MSARVYFVGFLKFLKKEKKQEFDELDLPPAPPPLEGFEDLPEPPEMPEHDFEKISAPDEDFKFDFPKEEPMPDLEDMDLDKEIGMGKDFDMGSDFNADKDFEKEMAMPELPEMEEPIQPRPLRQIPDISAAQTISASIEDHDHDIESQQDYPRRLFAQKRMRERPTARSVYVRVEDFKAMLGTINIIKNDLRNSEEALSKIEAIKNSKDRLFDRIKSHLDDLQKKLIFVDKTLFEEE